MANPFTRSLARRLKNRSLRAFVSHWDRLEVMVVSVYRQGKAVPADELEFQLVRTWLRQHYPEWRSTLESYWTATRVGGEAIKVDPFKLLLAAEHAADYVGNWSAMQHLPAARESLNLLIVALRKDVE